MSTAINSDEDAAKMTDLQRFSTDFHDDVGGVDVCVCVAVSDERRAEPVDSP